MRPDKLNVEMSVPVRSSRLHLAANIGQARSVAVGEYEVARMPLGDIEPHCDHYAE